MQNKPVSISKTNARTKKIQHDLSAAAAELHLSNQVLAQAAAGSTDASVKEAVTQILEVEKQLHAAVAELARITALLKAAEGDSASAGKAAPVTSPLRKKLAK